MLKNQFEGLKELTEEEKKQRRELLELIDEAFKREIDRIDFNTRQRIKAEKRRLKNE